MLSAKSANDASKGPAIFSPKVVLKREVITASILWVFSLLTSMAVAPYAARRKWNHNLIIGASTIVGTFFAEALGRMICKLPSKANIPESLDQAPAPLRFSQVDIEPEIVARPIRRPSRMSPSFTPPRPPASWNYAGPSAGYAPYYTYNGAYW